MSKPFQNLLLVDIPGEIWAPVPLPVYSEYYQVSNKGRIKSLEREVIKKNGHKYKLKERIIKQAICTNKYLHVMFCVNYQTSVQLSHILVGKAFIPNPENKRTINHKYGDVWDNDAEHLQWATQSENLKHSYDFLGRQSPKAQTGKSGKLHHRSKGVHCATLNISFGSQHEAQRLLGCNNVSDACAGKISHTNGLYFRTIK